MLNKTLTNQNQFPGCSFTSSNQYHVLPENRMVKYKKGHLIDQRGLYVIEISTEGGSLYIAALSTSSSDSHALQIHDRSFIKSFGDDYSVMATCLGFRGNKLILRPPKSIPSYNTHRSEKETANL